jgi:small-conductance mechanosensitive channel
VKTLYQTWEANALYDWAVAAAIALAVWLALAAVRFGVVRALKAISARTITVLDDIAVDVAASTKLWLLLPLALYAGATALDLAPRLERVIEVAAVVALLLQVALWANRFIRGWLQRKMERRREGDGEAITALGLIGFGARVLVWTLMLLFVLNHLGFDITALVAGLGIGGVAVALAVQNILGDLFASLSIVLDKPFVVGDFIVVDNLRGNVERIGVKTTHVRSLDGELLVFSNADLLKSRIRNFKHLNERRVLFKIGITYDTPVEKVERVAAMLREIIESQPSTRFDRAHFYAFRDFALEFEVVYHVLDRDYATYMGIQQAVNLEIMRRFRDAGIEFAFPTQTLYLRPQPGARGADGAA